MAASESRTTCFIRVTVMGSTTSVPTLFNKHYIVSATPSTSGTTLHIAGKGGDTREVLVAETFDELTSWLD